MVFPTFKYADLETLQLTSDPTRPPPKSIDAYHDIAFLPKQNSHWRLSLELCSSRLVLIFLGFCYNDDAIFCHV